MDKAQKQKPTTCGCFTRKKLQSKAYSKKQKIRKQPNVVGTVKFYSFYIIMCVIFKKKYQNDVIFSRKNLFSSIRRQKFPSIGPKMKSLFKFKTIFQEKYLIVLQNQKLKDFVHSTLYEIRCHFAGILKDNGRHGDVESRQSHNPIAICRYLLIKKVV